MILFGYGKTTAAIANKFGNCKIYDDKFKEEQSFGTNKFLPMSDYEANSEDLTIVSPGIAPHHKCVKKARNIMSDYDLFCEKMPFSIWISGTNGKTTTTQILDFLLKNRGSVCGGNIGTPVAEMDLGANIWILETSSFTLHYTQKASPNVYVLLPISQDHLSWHGNFNLYEEAKLKPLKTMQEGELAIVPKKYARIKTNAFLVTYKDYQDLAEFFDIDLEQITLRPPFLIDAVLALCVTKAIFGETDYKRLSNYKLDPHKLQELRDSKGRLWINDSKATNTDASICALQNFAEQKVHLILGGDDKGADQSKLFDFLMGKKISVYAIGQNANKILEECQKRGIEVFLCGFLDVAVEKINQNFIEGVALLSPAAASLDQFKSYAHRGEEFQKFVFVI